MIKLVFGLVIFFGVMGAAMFLGGDIQVFIDIPSLILMVGGCLGLVLVSFSFQDIADAFNCVLADVQDRVKLVKAAYFWLAMVRIILGVGAIGTIIGWVQMLSNLSDPDGIGPAMSVSLVTLLYGLLLAFTIAIPFHCVVRRRLANLTPSN